MEDKGATKFEFDAVSTAIGELRTRMIAQAAGVSGGGGDRTELIATLQAAQQSTQSQVLSLQTHLRALLRKAEMERASGSSSVDRAMVDDLKSEVHAALTELQAQVELLAEGKADAAKVEKALDSKAEAHLLHGKVDRLFCENLLSRFAVEVARQLGDMEQTQSTIRGDLQAAVERLMSTATHTAAQMDGAAGGGGEADDGDADGDGLGGTPSSLTIPAAMRERADGRGGAPFTVQAIHHATGGRASSAGPSRRRGTASPQEQLPPMGKGLLPTTVFVTGEGEPQAAVARSAFQPRRPSHPLTPGEQTLVQHRPSEQPARPKRLERPHSSSGRMNGSASAGMLTGMRA